MMQLANTGIILLMLITSIRQSASFLQSPQGQARLTMASAVSRQSILQSTKNGVILRLPESVWRPASSQHAQRIRELLQPGLLVPDSKMQRRQSTRRLGDPSWTGLDPKHPVYNFLIEYYGLKGTKGPRRLARWSPDFSMLLDFEKQLLQENHQLSSTVSSTDQHSGILLQGATQDDLGGALHLRGAVLQDDGILYSPSLYYASYNLSDAARAATAFLWYRSILQTTLQNEPVLHCYGLHEWAMQYHPVSAPPPPSAKYQSHLPLRVSRGTINRTVERRGVSCTHVDALRFFAPAAAPLNHCGATLQRSDQLRLEQPACVHAHMDLLKVTLKLQPFVSGELLQRVLELALCARQMDVLASPYDVSKYVADSVLKDVPNAAIAVETPEGRADYKRRQVLLMQKARPIRQELLRAYEAFLSLAFDECVIHEAMRTPMAERFAKASPGSPPWRRNLEVTS